MFKRTFPSTWVVALMCLFGIALVTADEPPYAIKHRHNDELNRQEKIFYADGSQEKILYTFRNSVDAEGKQITERVDEYVFRIEEKDDRPVLERVSITDQFGITYSGDQLRLDDEGVSFVNQGSERVWMRLDGSRLIKCNDGAGAGYEVDEGGRRLRTFDEHGKLTSVFQYEMRSLGLVPGSFPPVEKKEFHLAEFMTTNSRAEREHWKKTDDDKETGKQVWQLQNSADGVKHEMEDVDSFSFDPLSGGLINVKSPKADDSGSITQVTEHWKNDGSTVKIQKVVRRDKTVEVIRGVYGISEKAAYEVRTITRPAQGDTPERTSYYFRSSAGLWESADGKFWIKPDDNGKAIEYFQGTFEILDDGTGVQDGFRTDESGNRLVLDGAPVRSRKLLAYTNGVSKEAVFFGENYKDETGTVVRNKHGEVLQTIDVNGRATSIGYKTDDEDKQRIASITYPNGESWRTDDNGDTWYNAFTGRKKDPQDAVDISINRGNGTISYETEQDKTTVRLDGTIEIHDKLAHVRRMFDGHGQITSCLYDNGTRFDFEYRNVGKIAKAVVSKRLSVTAGGQRVSHADHVEQPVDDLRVDRNGRVSYTKTGQRHVHSPDGSTTLYDASGNVLSMTDPNGVRTEFQFDGQQLTSFTRAGKDFKWMGKRTDSGGMTLTKTANGKDSQVLLDDAYVSDQGSLTLEYSTSQDGYLAYQTLCADGSRREVWRDYSFRVHDAQDRIIERQRMEGDLQVFESFEYEDDDPVPVRVFDSFTHWVRGKKPVASSKVAPHRYEWNSDWAPGRGKWVGSFSLDSRGDPVFRKRNAFDYKITADREITQFMFVGSNAKCQWNTIKDRPAITEDGAGRAFRYEYRGDGSVGWLYELASFKDWTVKTAREAGSELKAINFNKLTGQPILVNFDGSRLIHLLNGAVVTIDAAGKVNRVQTECGQLKVATTRNGRVSSMAYDAKKEMKIGTATEDGKVSSLRYDPETDVVSIQFESGSVATLNWAGDLLVRNKDDRLIRTVSAHVFKRPTATRIVQQFGYDRSGRPDSIVQMKTSPQGKVTTTRFARQADSDDWLCKNETADDPTVTYESIRIDHDSGCQTRRLNASQITEYVNCAGDVVRKNGDGTIWQQSQR